MTASELPEVFTAREVARATGVSEDTIVDLVEAGAVRSVRTRRNREYLSRNEAIRLGRALTRGASVLPPGSVDRTPVFRIRSAANRARTPFALSSVAHIVVLVLATAATFGVQSTSRAQATALDPDRLRLVYLVTPGIGGGGGGGGAQALTPVSQAQRSGRRPLSSPVPAPVPPPPPEAPRLTESMPRPEPQIEAPVVPMEADRTDQVGVAEELPPRPESAGPGSGENAGSGEGAGVGDGHGGGVGDGEDAGTGGGPYRPGSGIEPPQLLREIKPHYTEAARQRGIQGDVVLEIVVQRDGSVGDVRVVRGLGHGLDQRAVDAVRQWTFSAARRRGVPVDVLVEVAMEFRIR